MSMMFRVPLGLLSPSGASARLSILIFHRVHQQRDPLFPGEVDAADFDNICAWAKSMFNVLPLDEAVARHAANSLPARALCITFDDGYADNHDVALPILRRHGITSTFFIASGFLNGGRMWNDTVIEAMRRTAHDRVDLRPLGIDGLGELATAAPSQRRQAIDQIIRAVKHRHPVERLALVDAVAEASGADLPNDLMMTSGQLKAMHAAGMQIGAHTVTHPILAALPVDQARAEIADNRDALQGTLGERISLFAYPNGKPGQDYTPDNVKLVQDLGFDAAVCTQWGAARGSTDRFQLPRFSPWEVQRTRFGLRLMQNLWST